MIKRLEWNRKTASAFAVAAALTIILAFALSPREITIAENITRKPIVWTFQRPNESVVVLDKLDATYTGDGLSANMYVTIGVYHENDLAYNGDDYLSMLTVINVTTSNLDGYIESVQVAAHKDQESKVDWQETSFKLENLSLAAREDGYSRSTQAYIKLAGVNRTRNARAKASVIWSLLTPNTQSHQLEVAFEITYYNGTAYNRIVQPFQLNIAGRGET